MSASRDGVGRSGLWFGLAALLVFSGECLAAIGWALSGAQPPQGGAIAIAAGVAILVACLWTLLLKRFLLDRHAQLTAELAALREGAAAHDALEREVAGGMEVQRRLRHDLRGALSPALLTADRLISHADPKVRRAGEIIVKSVDRASTLLADPAEASLPADP